MSDDPEERVDAVGPDTAVPPWLSLALDPPEGPARFVSKCLQAAEAGVALGKLRHAGWRVGRCLLGVPEYLRALAAASRADLSAALGWAGLALDEPLGPGFASAWGRLALALELRLPDAQRHLRLTFLEVAELDYAVAAGGGPGGPAALIDDEELLRQASSRWDEATRASLRKCESALAGVYRRADQLEPLP